MKILHICLQAPYNDYWGYQDNLLPKYHKKAGHDVTVLTTNTISRNGKIIFVDESKYVLNDGQVIIRKAYKQFYPNKISRIIKYFSIYSILCEEKPDLIFVHGLCNISVLETIKYIKKKNKKCKIVADNHVDYYNESPELKGNKMKRNLLIFAQQLLNKYMQKYYIKVFGVTPWRVQYQQEIYKIKKEKSDLLVLGGDDEKINYKQRVEVRKKIRLTLKIPENNFVIISGGKLDFAKNIHLLIKAVSDLDNKNISLVIFGEMDEATKSLISSDINNDYIKLIGWIDSDKVYDYFLASDLAVFPGTHSVLWEQACSCSLPGIYKHWEGMHHVDCGGNCKFLYKDSVEEIKSSISDLLSDDVKYRKMKEAAETKGKMPFLYSEISKKSLEI